MSWPEQIESYDDLFETEIRNPKLKKIETTKGAKLSTVLGNSNSAFACVCFGFRYSDFGFSLAWIRSNVLSRADKVIR